MRTPTSKVFVVCASPEALRSSGERRRVASAVALNDGM
jgi:hypothetical protein